MNRLYFTICFLLISSALAGNATGSGSDEAVKLSDVQVPRYLESADVLRWDRAVNLKREGESDIESGEWMRSRRESSLGMKIDTTRVRQRGEERIREGREKILQAEESIAELRSIAVANFTQMMTVEPHVYTLTIEGSSWKDFIDSTVPDLLGNLWSEGYSRLFFAGAYQFDNSSEYSSLAELEEELRSAFLAADDRYSLVVTDSFRPLLIDQDERLALQLPDGMSVPVGLNTALIVMQMVPLENGEVWIVSLRGIDLESGRIIANKTTLLPEYGAAVVEGEAPVVPTASVSVKINDQAEFLRRVEGSKRDFLFSVLHRDRVNTERVHRDILLFKTLIFRHLSGVISDTDFLMAIRESGDDVAQPTGRLLHGENAVWLINPVSGEAMQLYARHLEAGTDLKVGTFKLDITHPVQDDTHPVQDED